MKQDLDFTPDLEEGQKRLSGQSLVHYKTRIVRAAHILEELMCTGIDPKAKLKALFAGSGVGFIPYILARHTGWEMYGGDLNKSYIDRHPWVRDKVNIAYLDVTAMPYPDDTFEVAVCNHVLEHVPNWEGLVRELYRVMKRGGTVYLATPNIYRPNVPLKVLLKKKKQVSREARIDLHMGFAMKEIRTLFANFSHLESFNRAHVLINCPPYLRRPLSLMPDMAYDRFAPNNVIIAHK